MGWDTPEAPKGGRTWRTAAALLAVVAVAVVAAGVGGEGTQARDPVVLDVATAGAGRRTLPPAPGGTEAAAEASGAPATGPAPVPGPTTTTDRSNRAGGPVVAGVDDLRLVALAQRGPGRGALVSVDLDSGVRRTRAVMVVTTGTPRMAPLAGGDLAVVDGSRLSRVTTALDDTEEISGDRVFAVYPTPTGRHVWTVGEASGPAVRLLDADGGEQLRRTLPGYVEVVGTVGERLLLSAAGTMSLLGADGQLTTVAQGEFMAAAGELFAVLRCAPNALDCEIAVLDETGRTERSWPAPDGQPGLRGLVAEGFGVAQLSPDGRYLATIDFTSPSGVRVLDLDRGRVLDLPEALRPSNFGTMAWAPEGAALALGTPDAVQWFDVGSGEVTFVPVEGNVVEILVLPASPG